MHWNANSIDKHSQTIEELELFILQNQIHLISINETKLSEADNININNYTIIRKDRTSNGGGVAIIIKKQINYEQLDLLEEFDLELIAIKVTLNAHTFNFITLYLPPQAQLPSTSFFQKLASLPNLILCGDLNCKSKEWYSRKINTNGKQLEQILPQYNLAVVKNKKPTHYCAKTNNLDILDIIITSADINNKIINMSIPQDQLHSDHFPLIFEIDNMPVEQTRNKTITVINKELQNIIIEEKLANQNVSIQNLSLKTLIDTFENTVAVAKKQASTTKIKKVDNINLPKYILTLISIKKHRRQLANQFPSRLNKSSYNQICNVIREEIAAFKQSKLEKTCEQLADIKASESKFWSQLKKLESNNKQQQRDIPYLLHNSQKIFNNTDKAELFGEKLAATFKPYEGNIFDADHKQHIDSFVTSSQLFNYINDSKYDDKFSMNELEHAMKSLKRKAACPNIANNNILKDLEINGKNFILNIINQSYTNNIIPEEWKQAKVTMIPKKPNDRHNPDNYRPISITNTLCKISEKLIKNRLVYYLESNKLITDFQSGFRSNKSTIDNVFYFKQKCLEAFSIKRAKHVNKMGGIVFDIEKAFDKVWHQGILYKMHQLRIPKKIAEWIMNFLSNRTFIVKVNDKESKTHPISAGVPQGTILSPILFIIFFSDIPLSVKNYEHISRALLFADDLFKFYWDHNLKRLQVILQKYLDSLQEWLSKWRMKTAAHKCSYNIYTEHGNCKDEIHLEIYGKKINKENNTKYLGIYLDQNVSFNHHISEMKNRCNRKLSFIKALRSRKWDVKTQTKFHVYSALIRSITDYAAVLFQNISEHAKHEIETIQYHSMLHILKKPPQTSHKEMREQLNTDKLNIRHKNLKINYLQKALKNNQLIINLYNDHKQFCIDHNITDPKYSMFNTT